MFWAMNICLLSDLCHKVWQCQIPALPTNNSSLKTGRRDCMTDMLSDQTQFNILYHNKHNTKNNSTNEQN